MNENLLALLVAGAALSPFVWKIYRTWQKIKPLDSLEVVWRLSPTPETDAMLPDGLLDWLEQHWRGQAGQVGRKWFVRARNEQHEALNAVGLGSLVHTTVLTRGQVNDLVALTRPAEEDDLELLAFFQVEEPYSNALVVGHRAATYRLNSQAMSEWAARPATNLQKEGLRFFGLKTPKGIAANEAASLLDEKERVLFTAGKHAEWNRWSQYAKAWKALHRRDVWERYELKKPSVGKLRETLLGLSMSGMTDWHELDVITQRLVELHPELDLRAPGTASDKRDEALPLLN